jgi:hypothetical protein
MRGMTARSITGAAGTHVDHGRSAEIANVDPAETCTATLLSPEAAPVRGEVSVRDVPHSVHYSVAFARGTVRVLLAGQTRPFIARRRIDRGSRVYILSNIPRGLG